VLAEDVQGAKGLRLVNSHIFTVSPGELLLRL
jgi:hypothetical protein